MEKRLFTLEDLSRTITPQQYVDRFIPNDGNLHVSTCSELGAEMDSLYGGDLTDYPIEEIDHINDIIEDDSNTFEGYVIVFDGKEKRFFEVCGNPPTTYKDCQRTLEVSDDQAKEVHNKIREILISYGNPEYGDCIVDEICFLFGYPTTTDLYL